MMFLICLDPLLNNRRRKINYIEHTNEEVCSLLDDYNGERHFVSALYVFPKRWHMIVVQNVNNLLSELVLLFSLSLVYSLTNTKLFEITPLKTFAMLL